MSQNEKCTCKACKNTVFHCQICKFVRFLLPSSSWLLKISLAAHALYVLYLYREISVFRFWVFCGCEESMIWDHKSVFGFSKKTHPYSPKRCEMKRPISSHASCSFKCDPCQGDFHSASLLRKCCLGRFYSPSPSSGWAGGRIGPMQTTAAREATSCPSVSNRSQNYVNSLSGLSSKSNFFVKMNQKRFVAYGTLVKDYVESMKNRIKGVKN